MHTLEIVHRTRYTYSEPVMLADYRLMFRPRDSHDLRLLHTGLAIEPAAKVRWIHDAFGNSIAIATFEGATQTLEFVSAIQVEHYAAPPADPAIEDYARKLPFSYVSEEAPDLARYVERHYPDPNSTVSNWARQFLEGEGETQSDSFATLVRMCTGIHDSLNYAMRFELGTQPPSTTLELGGGTCRDYALLMMEGSRALGLAARFVTGYLYDPAFDRTSMQAARPEHPHAWMEAYLPGAGWIEFDPTNGIVGAERLIRVGVGRDPEQAMPIKGIFTGPSDVRIEAFVEVQVRLLDGQERDTAPSAIPAPAAAAPAR